MSKSMLNSNPKRKFCYTYWCNCDWYDECHDNKLKKKGSGKGCGDNHDQEEEERDTRRLDTDRAVERIDAEHRRDREGEETIQPEEMGYEVEVRYEDDDRQDSYEDEKTDHIEEEEEEEEEDNRDYPRSDEQTDEGRQRMDQPYQHGKQSHVHEYECSTGLFMEGQDRHNHRFAGVTGEEIKVPGGHVHKVWTRTDYFDHFHLISRLTGPAIPVGKNRIGKSKKHVHYAVGSTSIEDRHDHQFEFVTHIDSPLLPLEEDKGK